MSLLLESIKLLNGEFYNLSYHEFRMNRSLKALFGEGNITLEKLLLQHEYPKDGWYKCRICYDDKSRDVEFLPYTPKSISSLKIVNDDRIQYEHKFEDRAALNKLLTLRDTCDDILIIQKGFVTDTSFSNIAFRKGSVWVTPWTTLLKGTQRQKLIDEQKVLVEDIHVEDIKKFDACRVINALVEFDAPEIAIEHIVF
jgi:4-amino-4-deoxychorismate lyase